jgi:hypothetical protein
MERRAAEELLHVKGWLDRVDEIVERGTDAYLEPDDQVLFYSDGLVEARSPTGEFFGRDRPVDLVARNLAAGLPAPERVRRVIRGPFSSTSTASSTTTPAKITVGFTVTYWRSYTIRRVGITYQYKVCR